MNCYEINFCSQLTASRPVPPVKKSEDTSKSSKTHSKQETEDDESDSQSTEETEEPTSLPKYRPAMPPSRRLHPVSQTRSYHSILNSLRGTVKGFSRKQVKDIEEEDKKDEEEDEETPATTTVPEVTTTVEVVVETKEPENTIFDEVEDNVGYDEESTTTASPSLKVLTPSPTKVSARPPRRPIKIRIHQKTGSKGSFSTNYLKSATPSTLSAFSSDPLPSLTPSSSTKTSLSTSRHEESAEHLTDRIPFKNPERKKTYDKSSVTYTKSATPVVKQTNSQQTGATPGGKGSATNGRTSGIGFGSRYGYSRRYPFSRGNSTRILNGYKPSGTYQSNMPKTSSQAASKTYSPATSQSTVPDRTGDHRTPETVDSTTPKITLHSDIDSQKKTYAYDTERAQTKPEHDTSQGSSNPSSNINTSSSSSQSVSHTGSHSSAPVHNTQSVHPSTEQDTEISEASDNHKNTDEKKHKAEEPTSNSNKKPVQEEIINKEERDQTSKGNIGVPSQTKISPSFAERFPWLASRYPGRFGSSARQPFSRANGRATATRTSSSVGANTPILRETPRRFSGATGASGLSKLQESSKDFKDPFSDNIVKNGTGLGADKSLSSQYPVAGNSGIPVLSTSSAATSLNFSERQETSSAPIHREFSIGNKNDDSKDFINKKNLEMSAKNDKGTDLSSPKRSPTVNAHDLQKPLKGNLNEHEDTSSRTRSSSTATSRNYPRRGVGFNGRAYPFVSASRQFNSSRLPIKTQFEESSRMGSSDSQSSVSSAGSSPSSASQPVLSSRQITNIGTDPKSTTSASSFPSRPGIRGRTRFPNFRGKPTNGGHFKPGNGNGNYKI